MKRIREKKHIQPVEDFSSRPQSVAALLIGFIFFLYTMGFISSVLTLPEANNHLLHSKNSRTLFLTKYRQELDNKFSGDLTEMEKDAKKTIDDPDDGYDVNIIENEMRKGEGEMDVKDTMDDIEEIEIGAEERDDNAILSDEEEDAEIVEEVEIGGEERDDQVVLSDEEENEEIVDNEEELFEDEKIITLPETSVVPNSIWPVTTRNEDGKWEDIDHPADSSNPMTVPKFWSLPIHDQKLMSREKAMQVGTCITPDSSGNFQRGDACEKKDRTIFVAIASYRDWQCRFTLESIFSRAKYPNRIRVGVIDQIVDGDYHCDVPIKSCDSKPSQALCTHTDQVDTLQTDAILSVGPVFARHLGHRLYRGEYYAMQSDAHVAFTQDWDVDIIEQLEATGDEMAVLSTYLTDIQGSIDKKTGKSLRKTRPIMCNTAYEGGVQGTHLRHLSQPETELSITGQPQLEPYWAAGFSFSRGHFVVNVPYDQYQPMIFQGEEMSIAIRGFTIGYDFFAPERSICFHFYAQGKNQAGRAKVNHFWENAPKYEGTGKLAMKRLLGIVHMNPEIKTKEWLHTEEDRYGIGNVRTPEKFYAIFGVDVVNKTTVPNLCDFVKPGIMHKTFMKDLRPDGMGIDYKEITKPFPSYH